MQKVWDLTMKKQLDPDNMMFQTFMETQKRMQESLDIMNTQINRKMQQQQDRN